ncbi:MAG TPA: poly-beta-1,6-N-acetyl-D-glucosamine biosynthesis protein PgaD [Thermodesulfovibrionales bacterium]|jgi:poly-beta-1,6-N-acetyl-D-glucosamine biosynthesis protein PgaD|nr:poly-beta-1,6-N-acetyl-D-glucosamine biosynthesis protein PgaD [Thermodesulfovibrionales bacterium]
MPEIEIIDKPKLKSFLRKTTELSFTSLMWGLWFYLFLPLLNLVLWVLGIQYFYIEVFELAGYKGLINLLLKAGWVILGVFLILRFWGYYNYWRFGKRERRKSFPSETLEKTVEYFQVSPEQIQDLQSSKEIVWPLQHELK